MRRTFDLTAKDLLQNLRDRKTFVFLLAMPIIFTLLFGFAFRGVGQESDPRLPVGYLDQDQGRFSSQLRTLLEDSALLRLEIDPQITPSKLEDKVVDEDLAAALVIPAGFSQALLTSQPMQLQVMLLPGAQASPSIQEELLAITNRLLSAARVAGVITAVRGDPSGFDDSFAQALVAWQEPPVRLVSHETGAVSQETPGNSPSSFAHSAPGMMVQFAIAGLLGASEVLLHERKSRTLSRLLTTPITRPQVLAGHYLAIVLLILGQFALLIVFGQIFLKLDYFSQSGATVLMMLATALCIGALGLLIGVVAKNEEQRVIFSLLPMFIFSGLGGAWVPLEITGETFQAIGHISPVAWAMDGFKDILIRGAGLERVWLPALALAGFTVLFLGLAIWRFRVASE